MQKIVFTLHNPFFQQSFDKEAHVRSSSSLLQIICDFDLYFQLCIFNDPGHSLLG